MKTDLDHLPDAKQRELDYVRRVLFEEFEAAHALGSQKWKKQGRILKVVLYGSYARGDWVDDQVGGYQSDYDILVVVNDDRLVDFEFWSAAEDRLMRDVLITGRLSAPVGLIVHSLTDVNLQLERGRPFFVDAVAQGIALYEAEGFPFAQPSKLPPEEALGEASRHFDKWFPSANEYLEHGSDAILRGWNGKAAFELHQATERFYHCVLLTLTLYSPKSHRLNFLRSRAEEAAPELIAAWPRADKFSRRCFELLREAYVNARYSEHYVITKEELDWLAERIGVLQALVEKVCRRRLDGLPPPP